MWDMKKKTIYYEDELKDEFSGSHITPRTIDDSYPYLRKGVGGRLLHIFWYRLVAVPVAAVCMQLFFHHKIVNRRVLKEYHKSGYVLYGNHTQPGADAVIPTLVCHPKKVSVIVHPDNVSMPVLGRITPYLGALPLPDTPKAAMHFMQAIQSELSDKSCLMIYPEAHIWPYYTGIRPFTDLSFRYPVTAKVPVFCLTNTYQKRRFSKRPRMVTYIDGPFFPDPSATAKIQKKQLRDNVYETMCLRALNSTMTVIDYVKKEPS